MNMDSKMEDGQLIQQVLAGNGRCFSELVSRYQRSVHAMAYGMLGNQQDAEDVTQDVFVTAYRKLATFEGRSSFLTWLRRIAFNLSIDLKRKQKSKVSHSLSMPEELISTNTPSMVDAMIASETGALVRRAIDSLPDDQKAIVILRDLQDLDYNEIAELLTIPIGTVRSRLHRARLELKATLERMGITSTHQPSPAKVSIVSHERGRS